MLSLRRLRALLSPKSLVGSTRLVFLSACHSQHAAEVFVDAGVPHVVAVRSELKVSPRRPVPGPRRPLHPPVIYRALASSR